MIVRFSSSSPPRDSSFDNLDIQVSQLLDGDYGCYLWPSAIVLSKFLLTTSTAPVPPSTDGKFILELGSGVGLPSLVLAAGGRRGKRGVIATDFNAKSLQNLRKQAAVNKLADNLHVSHLDWNDIDFKWAKDDDDSIIPVLLSSESNSTTTTTTTTDGIFFDKLDYIIGADIFYDPVSFDKILCCISFLLHHSPPSVFCLVTYQERSSKRSIQHLLDRWGLVGEQQEHFNTSHIIVTTSSSFHDEFKPLDLGSGELDVYLFKIKRKAFPI